MNTLSKFKLAISALSFMCVSSYSYAKDVLVIWEDEGKSYALDQAIESFEKKYDCEVVIKEINPVYQFNEYLSAKEKPDVFVLMSDRISNAADLGLIEHLDFMSDDKNLYSDIAVNAFTYNGKIWAGPRSIESLVIFYNKDIMEYPFEYFDEYVDYAKQRKAEGKYGLIGKIDNFYFAYGIISGMGGYTFGVNPDGSFNESNIGLNTKGALEGMELIKEYATNYMPKSMITDNGWEEMDELFIEGKASAVISGPWNLDKYAKAGVNYGVVPLPILPNGNYTTPFFGAKGYVVSKESKKSTLAKKFIRHINQPEYAMIRYMATAELVPTNAILSNPQIQHDDFANAISTQITHTDVMPTTQRMNKVWDIMSECLSNVVHDKMSVHDAADLAVEKIRAYN